MLARRSQIRFNLDTPLGPGAYCGLRLRKNACQTKPDAPATNKYTILCLETMDQVRQPEPPAHARNAGGGGNLHDTTQTENMEARTEHVQMDRHHPSHDPKNGGKAHTHSVTDKTQILLPAAAKSAMQHTGLLQK